MLASPACPLLLAATLALSTAVSALPLAPPSSPERRGYSPATPPAQFIDYFPTFTSPSAGDVFQAGGDILISWLVGGRAFSSVNERFGRSARG